MRATPQRTAGHPQPASPASPDSISSFRCIISGATGLLESDKKKLNSNTNMFHNSAKHNINKQNKCNMAETRLECISWLAQSRFARSRGSAASMPALGRIHCLEARLPSTKTDFKPGRVCEKLPWLQHGSLSLSFPFSLSISTYIYVYMHINIAHKTNFN